MKKLLFGLFFLTFVGCTEPVLSPDEYTIVDTIKENRNSFNVVLSYDVVVMVKEDSSFHYGRQYDGMLVDITFKKIKNYYK
jgi:hypothetical protein